MSDQVLDIPVIQRQSGLRVHGIRGAENADKFISVKLRNDDGR